LIFGGLELTFALDYGLRRNFGFRIRRKKSYKVVTWYSETTPSRPATIRPEALIKITPPRQLRTVACCSSCTICKIRFTRT